MLIFKQLCTIDSPAQESVCKGPNLHLYHIRQGVAEYPGLMHRVKKVAFRTRLQSGLSLRVYNHHFFTRNNSLLDLNLQCHAPKLMNVNQECHLLFCHSFLPLARNWCLVLVGTPVSFPEKVVLPQFSWKTEFVLLAKEPGIDAKNQLAKYQKTVVLVQFN